jgi:hypothetical protein
VGNHNRIFAPQPAAFDGTSIAIPPSWRRRLIEDVENEETNETNSDDLQFQLASFRYATGAVPSIHIIVNPISAL